MLCKNESIGISVKLGLLFLLLSVSCKDSYTLYDTEVVPTYFCQNKEPLPIDALFPAWIIPSTNYFVTVHLMEDYFFKVFSKKDYSLLDTLIYKGRGPGELVNIGFIDDWEEKDGEMRILSYYGGKACWINIDQSLKQRRSVYTPLLEKGQEFTSDLLAKIATVHILSEDNLLLFMAPFPVGLEPEYVVPYFVIYDKVSGKVSEPYSLSVIPGEKNERFREVYNLTSALSKDKRFIAAAIDGLKTIQIIDLRTGQAKEVKFPDSPKRMEDVNPGVFNFETAKATERFLWVSHRYEKPESHVRCEIYLIDWQGQPQYTLLFDKAIRTFYPVETEQALYAVDAEDIIYRYDLRDFYARVNK